ncbi:Mu transposase C-terminal domain-containing protein [Dyella tabacisoli]
MSDQNQRSVATSRARKPTVLRVQKGADVVYQNCAAKVLAACSSTQILISISGTDKAIWVSAGELSGYLSTHVGADGTALKAELVVSGAELDRANQWVMSFAPYARNEFLSSSAQSEIAQAMNASSRTVRRHFDRYLFDPSPEHQLPWKPGPEPGSSLLPKPVDEIIFKAIAEKYESPERASVAATRLYAAKLARAAGYAPPSYNAVSERVKRCDRWRAARKRHGRVRGDAKAGPAGGGIEVEEPLQYVQMDHAIVDVIVVDPVTREEIGRPWITLAIDVATRCIVGFYLTFDSPSQTSVALALEHSCCPKDEWCKKIGFNDEWRPFGIMKCIGWDNAKCFKATSLVTACERIGIQPKFRQIRHPEHGAYIERFIGTYMGKVHLLKGTTFSNTKQREDYCSQKKAVMTLRELELWTAHQIAVYHNTRHSSLGVTPLEAWDSAWTRDGKYVIPPFPADRRSFRLSLLPGKHRMVGREGISRFNLKYWDNSLVPWIGDGNRYWVAHDQRNVSRVYIRLRDIWIDVPWRDRSRRPCALFELERSKLAVRSRHDRAYSEAAIFDHLEHSCRVEDEAIVTTRKERRDRARRPPDDRQHKETSPSSVDYSVASSLSTDPHEALR